MTIPKLSNKNSNELTEWLLKKQKESNLNLEIFLNIMYESGTVQKPILYLNTKELFGLKYEETVAVDRNVLFESLGKIRAIIDSGSNEWDVNAKIWHYKITKVNQYFIKLSNSIEVIFGYITPTHHERSIENYLNDLLINIDFDKIGINPNQLSIDNNRINYNEIVEYNVKIMDKVLRLSVLPKAGKILEDYQEASNQVESPIELDITSSLSNITSFLMHDAEQRLKIRLDVELDQIRANTSGGSWNYESFINDYHSIIANEILIKLNGVQDNIRYTERIDQNNKAKNPPTDHQEITQININLTEDNSITIHENKMSMDNSIKIQETYVKNNTEINKISTKNETTINKTTNNHFEKNIAANDNTINNSFVANNNKHYITKKNKKEVTNKDASPDINSSGNSKQKKNNLSTTKKTRLAAIAIFHIYQEIKISPINHNLIASSYGHKSGQKLSEKYSEFYNESSRIGDPGSKRKIRARIKLLKEVEGLFGEKYNSKAKEELGLVENLLDAYK